MAEVDKDLRNKILAMDPAELRVHFFRPDEGVKIYRMSRGRVLDLAMESDGLYKIGRMCLIDKAKFEENLEKYKLTPKEGHYYETRKFTLTLSD